MTGPDLSEDEFWDLARVMKMQEAAVTDYDGILDQIEAIRKENNKVWMKLARLALQADPENAKRIFNQIAANDQRVVELTRRLADD